MVAAMRDKMKNAMRYVPVYFFVLTAVFILSAVCAVICRCSVSFADFFTDHITVWVRLVLAKVTGVLPFSLGEAIVLTLPFTFAFVIWIGVRVIRQNDKKKYIRYILALVSVLLVILTLFFTTLSSAYFTTAIDKRVGMERTDVSAVELADAAKALLAVINEEKDKFAFVDNSFSVMPYSLRELNGKLNDAYKSICRKYPFISDFRSNVKPVAVSEVMSYLHITGVYTFYTGEANINIVFPDYTIPYTQAHEMAHQRGIAREEEANFVAFLVCMESDDPYIRYSGALNLFEYVISALHTADADLYRDAWTDMDGKVRGELIAYSEFYEKYRDNTAAKVSGKINDGYLQAQGQSAGIRSYGLVTDLVVAYFRELGKISH